MEELYLAIMGKLSEIDNIAMIDEDKGQLDSYNDGYPLTYPAILVSTPEVYYNDAVRSYQTGVVTVQVRLILDTYDDTHYGSTQENSVKDRMSLFRSVQKSLHGFAPNLEHEDGEVINIYCGRLCRQSARVYSISGGINVYETTFQCSVKDLMPVDYYGTMSVGIRPDKG